MTGDGTNDAPALAQADVGVAMNTGTSAAKEAGNMVDLDSNPTKLIEIVEIGKQLLITRGSLTTFSIANDVAKYFAILPAMFAPVYPGLDRLNVMHLHSPSSAILSAVIFNALVIVALVPLALRGVRYTPSSAADDAAPQPAGLRRRRADRPVRRDQAHRPRSSSSSPESGDPMTMLRQTLAGLRLLLAFTVVFGLGLPAADDGRRPGRLPRPGQRLDRRSVQGKDVGSSLIGQEFTGAQWFHSRPSAGVVRRPGLGRHQPRPELARPAEGGRTRPAPRSPPQDGVAPADVPPDAVTSSGSGLDPDISPAYADLQVARVAQARGMSVADVQQLVDDHTQGRVLGFLGEPRVNVLELNIALARSAGG